MPDLLIRPSDLRGLGRLAADATTGITGVVEAMHRNIALTPGVFARSPEGPAPGIAGPIYQTIGATAKLVGKVMDVSLGLLLPGAPSERSSRARDTTLGAANGVLGDHLARSDNPLAVKMSLRRDGHALPGGRPALAQAVPGATGRVAVLVHGLCASDHMWSRKPGDEDDAMTHDLAARMATELGYTVVHLNYNSGLHISTNGWEFAQKLELLLGDWPVPVESLTIIGHSMGGLVARSACHYGELAGHGWRGHLSKLVMLGAPHHGSPLERGGNLIDIALGVSPYTAPFARLGQVRSAGITDLRHGNLVDEDWNDGARFERTGDRRTQVPLPTGVECFAVAATVGVAQSGPRATDRLVTVSSALGRHRNPDRTLPFAKSHQTVVTECSHTAMLHHPQVHDQVVRWLSD